MDNNVHYTLVGAFVIVLVSAIVFCVVWLSSGFAIVQYSNYLIYSQESVSGLSIDASVEYNGVSVGTVKSITLNRDNPRLVEVMLNISSTTPITKGTVAVLTSRGITGVAFIALKDSGTDLRPLLAVNGQPYPVIPTSPSLFMRLDIALKHLSENLQTVAESFHSLLNKDNLKSIKDILQNIDHISGTIADNSDRLNTLLVNTSQASAQLRPLLQNSTYTLRTISTQTLPATYQLLTNLNEAVRTLGEVSVMLKQNPAMLVRGVAPAPPGPGEKP
jgi:phospholipid/cholesterol/gamma-HCH transport system substrate-binding protein